MAGKLSLHVFSEILGLLKPLPKVFFLFLGIIKNFYVFNNELIGGVFIVQFCLDLGFWSYLLRQIHLFDDILRGVLDPTEGSGQPKVTKLNRAVLIDKHICWL